MARRTRSEPGEPAAASKKTNFTIWAKGPDAERIERAVTAASERTGFPWSTSAWLLAQVLKGVEEEEKQRGTGGKK
jgi:hypothetical protein